MTAQSGTITSYTAYGFYSQSGKIVIGTATINITTVGTAAGNMIVTLPIAAKTTSNQNWVGSAYERAATGKTGVCRIDANGGATTMLIRDYNFVTFFASGNTVDVTFIYEVA